MSEIKNYYGWLCIKSHVDPYGFTFIEGVIYYFRYDDRTYDSDFNRKFEALYGDKGKRKYVQTVEAKPL